MVKIQGGKAGSVSRLKKDFERSQGGRTWLKGIKEDIVVRFLTEPDEWYAFREHYDPSANFFPCIGKDNDCPGCKSTNPKVQRTSRRYAANVLDVANGSVIPLKLPLDLANRLVASYERAGNTITDRDYELHRMGSGLETTYDRTPEAPSTVKLDAYELHDLEQVLIHQFEDAFGLEAEDVDEPAPTLPKERTPSRKEREELEKEAVQRRVTEELIDTDSDLDDDTDIPSEPSGVPEQDATDDEAELTEEEALKMSKKQLKALADQLGLEVDGRWSVQKLVDHIFSEAGEEDE
jgi:hypothetical protein